MKLKSYNATRLFASFRAPSSQLVQLLANLEIKECTMKQSQSLHS